MNLPSHLMQVPSPPFAPRRTALAQGQRSFFFGMMGAPYQSETVTSLFRMVEAALTAGHPVTVWTCGHATGLSQSTLVRPKDSFLSGEAESFNPNTAELIQALFRRHGQAGRLDWLVCRYCMQERGATQQIEQVKVKISATFQYYLSQADVSLVLGVKS